MDIFLFGRRKIPLEMVIVSVKVSEIKVNICLWHTLLMSSEQWCLLLPRQGGIMAVSGKSLIVTIAGVRRGLASASRRQRPETPHPAVHSRRPPPHRSGAEVAKFCFRSTSDLSS